MGAQKGSFLGSGGREVLDRGSGTLNFGSGRPFLTIFGPRFWDDPQGAVPQTKQSPRYGIWEGSRPLKRVDFGPFLDPFWSFSMRPLEGALPSSDWNMDVSGRGP